MFRLFADWGLVHFDIAKPCHGLFAISYINIYHVSRSSHRAATFILSGVDRLEEQMLWQCVCVRMVSAMVVFSKLMPGYFDYRIP